MKRIGILLPFNTKIGDIVEDDLGNRYEVLEGYKLKFIGGN